MKKYIWQIIGLVFLGLLIGALATHFIWFTAVQGLVESDVTAAILTGEVVTGTLNHTERYEDGYLAYVQTDRFGEVTVKIPADVQRNLTDGVTVQLTCDLNLKEINNG